MPFIQPQARKGSTDAKARIADGGEAAAEEPQAQEPGQVTRRGPAMQCLGRVVLGFFLLMILLAALFLL
jgi:hypothetical protein